MLTYTPPSSKTSKPNEKPWVLMFLAFVWLWPGIINRDLWGGEMAFFTAVQNLQHNGLVPEVLNQPYVFHSPLILWLASVSQHWFSPWLMHAYTATRLVTVLCMVIAFWCLGGAGRELLGKYHGRSVVLIAIGCPGLMVFGHTLGNMPMIFAAICSFLYGSILGRRKTLYGGLLMGLGWLFAFLAGNFPPFIFLFIFSGLLFFSPYWRIKPYAIALMIACCISLPLIPIFPYLLWQNAPQSFWLWWNDFALGDYGGFLHFDIGFSLGAIIKNTLWFALPAWLLTLWTLWQRHLLNQRVIWFCLTWCLLALLMLSLHRHLHRDSLIWILPPLAILGTAGLDTMRRGFASFLNWFGIMVFGIMALAVWGMFFAVNYHTPQWLSDLAQSFNPRFSPDWDYFPMLLALSFTPIWLWAVTRKHIRGRQAVTNWAAGITLVWTLLLSILMPWIDMTKSYRPLVEEMYHAIEQQNIPCINSIDKTALLAWNLYGDFPVQTFANQTCDYHLIKQYSVTNFQNRPEILWQGKRSPRDQENYLLIHDIQ